VRPDSLRKLEGVFIPSNVSLEHFTVCFATLEEHEDPAKDVQDPVFAGRTANGPTKNMRDPVFAGRTANGPVSLCSRDERSRQAG
jgi:hypothetical protein